VSRRRCRTTARSLVRLCMPPSAHRIDPAPHRPTDCRCGDFSEELVSKLVGYGSILLNWATPTPHAARSCPRHPLRTSSDEFFESGVQQTVHSVLRESGSRARLHAHCSDRSVPE